MMNPNPHFSPADRNEAVEAVLAEICSPPANLLGRGIWRCGAALVLHRSAALSPRCVFTGDPAAGVVSERLTPEVNRPNLMRRILGMMGVPVEREQQASIDIPVSSAILFQRWTLFLSGAFIFVLGVALILWGCATPPKELKIIVGVLMACGGPLLYLMNAPTLGLFHIDGDYLWLYGAHEAYLAELEPWPYRVPNP